MALTVTSNLNGNVGTASAVATQIVLSTASSAVELAISGTGGARVAKGSTKVPAPTLNATTDRSVLAGSGYRLLLAEPGSGGITSIFVYANAGETLTYDISIPKSGVSQ